MKDWRREGGGIEVSNLRERDGALLYLFIPIPPQVESPTSQLNTP